MKIEILQEPSHYDSELQTFQSQPVFIWNSFNCQSLCRSTYKEYTESYFYFFKDSPNHIPTMSQQEESDPYAPQLCVSGGEQDSQQIYKRRVEKSNEKSIQGKWTEEENLKYILFMDYHNKIFISKEKRKSERIFKSLSDFLVTRTPRQCRSHFQKIMNKFKKLKKVKQYYQQQLGVDKYQQYLDKISKDVQPPPLKTQQTTETKLVTSISTEVQTEPFKVQLSDLSNPELLNLMTLLNEFQKTQMPFWMNHPLPPRFPM